MKILIIGGGNMGMTYAQNFLHTHIVTNESLFILEKSMKKADELRKLGIGTVYGEPGDFVEKVDLIIMAVKPQDTNELFSTIKDYVDPQQVILSIMAGVKMETISTALGNQKIIRAMPNLPAQIGDGMTVFTSSADVTRIELVMVQNLLNATGKTLYVENEELLNAATAISGSGPAYVFFYMQGLINSAKSMGFSQSEAEMLSFQTFRGAVELFNKFDFSCEEWIAKVSSKGGTTEAAFESFHSSRLNDLMDDGYRAALIRAEELS